MKKFVKRKMEKFLNKIICGDSLEILKTLLGMGLPRVRAFLEANPETKEEIIKLLK